MVHFYKIFFISKFVKEWGGIKNPIVFQYQLISPFPFLFPEQALTIRVAVNKFPNKLAPKAPNKILNNSPFCSFVSFLIVLGLLLLKY